VFKKRKLATPIKQPQAEEKNPHGKAVNDGDGGQIHDERDKNPYRQERHTDNPKKNLKTRPLLKTT